MAVCAVEKVTLRSTNIIFATITKNNRKCHSYTPFSGQFWKLCTWFGNSAVNFDNTTWCIHIKKTSQVARISADVFELSAFNFGDSAHRIRCMKLPFRRSAALRPEHTMRTKCAISDAFVRDCGFAYCPIVWLSTCIPYQLNNFQTTQKRNLGRTRPRLRTLYA